MHRFSSLQWAAIGFVSGIILTYICFQIFSSNNFPSDADHAKICAEKFPNQFTNLENKPADGPSCPKCPCLYSEEILPPPKYHANLKENLETNHEGEVRVAWYEVPGAKKYNIHVYDQTNKIIKRFSTSRTLMYLKDIPLPKGVSEAQYYIRLGTVNGLDKEGEQGPIRNLMVKPQAGVVAPQIQEIRVED